MSSFVEDFELCPVSPDEADSVSQMAHEIWPIVYRDLISESQIRYMLDWMYDPAQIRRDMEEGTCYCWIEKENQRAGFTAFGPVENGKVCELHKLYLKPEFHRQGLGIAALKSIETILRENRAGGRCRSHRTQSQPQQSPCHSTLPKSRIHSRKRRLQRNRQRICDGRLCVSQTT